MMTRIPGRWRQRDAAWLISFGQSSPSRSTLVPESGLRGFEVHAADGDGNYYVVQARMGGASTTPMIVGQFKGIDAAEEAVQYATRVLAGNHGRRWRWMKRTVLAAVGVYIGFWIGSLGAPIPTSAIAGPATFPNAFAAPPMPPSAALPPNTGNVMTAKDSLTIPSDIKKVLQP